MIGEVARSKALAVVLGKANVVDTKGNKVDVSEFAAGFADSGEDSTDEDGFDTSDAAAMLTQANSGHEGHSHGAERDSHGRKANNEHFGHDHK